MRTPELLLSAVQYTVIAPRDRPNKLSNGPFLRCSLQFDPFYENEQQNN